MFYKTISSKSLIGFEEYELTSLTEVPLLGRTGLIKRIRLRLKSRFQKIFGRQDRRIIYRQHV